MNFSRMQIRGGRHRNDTQLSSGMPRTGVIAKGKSQQEESSLAKRDLNEIMRVQAEDDSIMGFYNGKFVPLQYIIDKVLGDAPGSAQNPIQVTIRSFDDLQRDPTFKDAVKIWTPENQDYFNFQVARWAVAAAGTRTKTGAFKSKCISDPLFQYVIKEEIEGKWVSYEPNSMPIEKRVWLNDPEEVGKLHNSKLLLGEYCYKYTREDKKEVLLPWKWLGILELELKVLTAMGIPNLFTFTVPSKYNVVQITNTLKAYIRDATLYNIPFSNLSFWFVRQKQMIDKIINGEKRKMPHWMAVIAPTAETINLIKAAKDAVVHRAIANSRKTTDELSNELFGFADDDEPKEVFNGHGEEIEPQQQEMFFDEDEEPAFEEDEEMFFVEEEDGQEPQDASTAPLDWLTDATVNKFKHAKNSQMLGKAIMEATSCERACVKEAWDKYNGGKFSRNGNSRVKIGYNIALICLELEDRADEAYQIAKSILGDEDF